MVERTLFLLKPDAVERNISGEIIQRIERVGFKIIAAKIIVPTKELGRKHYPDDKGWKLNVGKRTIEDCEKYSIDLMKSLGTVDPLEIGEKVKEWLAEFLSSGRVFAFVLEGDNAVERLRSIVGNTVPAKAAPGTIRGDFSLESAISANRESRPIHNLVHASGSVEEARHEISLWFDSSEIYS